MTRTTVFRQPLRAFALLALAVALFAGSGAVATPAAATRVGPTLDSLSAGCKVIQDRVDALVAEWGRLYNDRNSTQAQLDAVRGQLSDAGNDWNALGCRAVFGNISAAKPVSQPNALPVRIENADVLAPDSTPPTVVGRFPAAAAKPLTKV